MSSLFTIIGAVILFLLSLIGIQKGKNNRLKKKVKHAETERDTETKRKKVLQEAVKVKDDLSNKQKESAVKKEEVEQSIEEGGLDVKKQQVIIDDINKRFNDSQQL